MTRVPDYDDIAQVFATEYATVLKDAANIAIVTHSQGGLILQRFLEWMLNNGKGRDLKRIRTVVMLACPNGGSEYLESVRHVLGLGRHPQVGNLDVLDRRIADTQRRILDDIVRADGVGDHQCRIRFHVYAGSSDNVVKPASAQGAFPGALTLAGDHFSILDPAAPGNRTAEAVKHHILTDLTIPRDGTGEEASSRGRPASSPNDVTPALGQDPRLWSLQAETYVAMLEHQGGGMLEDPPESATAREWEVRDWLMARAKAFASAEVWELWQKSALAHAVLDDYVGEEWPQWPYEDVSAEMEEDPDFRRLRQAREEAGKQLTEQVRTELGVRASRAPMQVPPPLSKSLAASDTGDTHALIEAARQLMALLDQVGTVQGKYKVGLQGAQGVQVGDAGRQYNAFNSVSPVVEIRPGQPRNEAAFGEAFDAAGGRSRLGRALHEVYDDGPGWVQHFDGGSSGRPTVICALFGQSAVAVDRGVWDALGRLGSGTHVTGTAAVGFPVAREGRPLITADDSPIELKGGAWGRGRLVPVTTDGWRWEPEVALDSEACRDGDTGVSLRGAVDLRLRLAARIPLVAEGLRVTEAGRSQMLAVLPSTGLTDLIGSLARRYGLELADLTWQETPEPEGYNNSRFATYHLVIPGATGNTALLGSLSLMLPSGRGTEVRAIADLGIDFAAIQPGITSDRIASGLGITPAELIAFFTGAWQAATALVLTTGKPAPDLPPAGAPRLELYIQNCHPEFGSGPRILRTLDLVDLSVFGRTRKTHLGDLSVGVTTPLGLRTEESRSIVRQALITMANDFGFTAADTAQI